MHREDCANAKRLKEEPERIIAVEWADDVKGSYIVSINIVANERRGLLSDISKALL